MLVPIGARGLGELPAQDLNRRLASGEGTVRSGVVENIVGKPDSYGCFWLGGEEYCYSADGLGYSITFGGLT